MTDASAHMQIYSDHVYFYHFLSKWERGKTSNELSFQPDYASVSVWNCGFVPLLDRC